ncbi:dimethyl sulfoxide reductase anchor subunit family protein [Propionibacteriaceae bacterium G1746]|uniref:dimethyl sulfoxide reductase anchor subunit family protein n=1 Tax=Aestuariimicrobium sp. G57 TaxID=3418485 RepID=UPI003C1DED52
MLHEMPLVIFTIFASMSAGSFIVLGLVHVFGVRVPEKVMDKVTDPALYAIGPLLVLGLGASMFHLGSPLRAVNAIRHFPASALSREIVFGIAFLGLGAAFAVLQWFKWFNHRLRQVLAIVTAAVGVLLVWTISQVYSLRSVPAWATAYTPLRFFITAGLLGGLAVAAAVVIASYVRTRRNVAYNEDERGLVRRVLEGIAVGSVALMGAKYVAQPAYFGYLANHADPSAQASLSVLTDTYSGFSAAQNILVFLGVMAMVVLLYRLARGAEVKGLLPALAVVAFALVFVGEFFGRQLFYASMVSSGGF